MKFSNRIKVLRAEHNLSQEELANKLGISRQAVSKWERAESSPDTDNLICLAKIYNISLDELLQTDESIEEIADNKRLISEDNDNNIIIRRDSPLSFWYRFPYALFVTVLFLLTEYLGISGILVGFSL